MRISVTGASGFIGSALCPVLRNAGHEVLASAPRSGSMRGAQAVIHLAAIAHRSASVDELRRVNVDLTRQVGQAAAADGASLVFLSSVKVHGEASHAPLTEGSAIAPADAYAESKARAEDALRAIPGLRLTVLRPPLVYGPGVKANFLALMNAIARGMPLPLASIQNRRSLVSVANLVDAIRVCLSSEGTFLIADGEAQSTPQLCRRIGEALQRPARLFPFPVRFLPRKLAASLEVDDSSIRRKVGWRPPLPVEEALRATAHWYHGR